jgi:hypothetical protein
MTTVACVGCDPVTGISLAFTGFCWLAFIMRRIKRQKPTKAK